jgi:hypothetical protein
MDTNLQREGGGMKVSCSQPCHATVTVASRVTSRTARPMRRVTSIILASFLQLASFAANAT